MCSETRANKIRKLSVKDRGIRIFGVAHKNNDLVKSDH